ncbi:Gfo/Idh/MocA family protein [Aquisalimonas asiatica]|uniref:Predicted dehydrogenase n=1 Tax=Aquisalimonas asiatica TaxID=406100 RepID=A0A1H8RGL1_9GAMM|nr:Gfo/Idh/MocA family oxidoreductase [Aquisalimonas asiatica]SEO65535.1 Predicted dehydrogenase [Aquisalimonas asiatica]
MAASNAVFQWGIVSPGRIAQTFASALSSVDDARLGAVTSRDTDRGRAFTEAFPQPGPEPAVYTDYAAMLADPSIDAVYVASPHRFHHEQVLAALRAGKPVLCEKPMTVTAAQAEELMQVADQQGVFLMEAMWSRFLPVWQQVRRWLDDGRIGPVHTLHSEFCVDMPRNTSDRLFDPALAGGNLLDMGVYCIALSRFVTGRDPDRVQSATRLGPTGVDERTAAILDYGDLVSQFTSSFLGQRRNGFRIEGERGVIEIDALFWASESARLTEVTAAESPAVERFEQPHRGNGFEYQIEAAMASIRAGERECPGMPWAATLGTARVMDRMLRDAGVTFPFL